MAKAMAKAMVKQLEKAFKVIATTAESEGTEPGSAEAKP